VFVEVGTSKTQKPKGAGTKAFSDFFSSYLLLTVSLPELTHILASMRHILQPEASQPRVIDTNLGSVEPTNTLIAQQRNPMVTKKVMSKKTFSPKMFQNSNFTFNEFTCVNRKE